MPRQRTLADKERDAGAVELYRRGMTYRQIAAQMGWRSPASVGNAISRALADDHQAANEEVRQILLDRLQDYRRSAWEVLTGTHYVTTQSGKLVEGPGGGYLEDDAPVLNALDRLLKIDDREAVLRDLYPAAKHRVEVITEDAIDAECAALSRQIALNDARAAADTGTA